MIAQTKALEDENRRLKKMFAELSMQNELLKEALGKKGRGHPLPGRQMRAFAVGQRREMVETAVARRRASIALACRTFGVSEACYRYSPKLRDENEEIADLLVGLTEARKTWGFGLCFLHPRNVQGRLWILLPGNACLHA
jgi:putative transposase